jgi:hypothetical protein
MVLVLWCDEAERLVRQVVGGMSMTMLDVLALLVGAALGSASSALKAHLHSLRRPPASLRAGGECHRGVPALPAPVQLPRGPGRQDRPGAPGQALACRTSLREQSRLTDSFAARQERVPKHRRDDSAEAQTRSVVLDTGRN